MHHPEHGGSSVGIVRAGRYVMIQLPEAAAIRTPLADILQRIDMLRSRLRLK